MSGQGCDGIRDLLPEWALGALDSEAGAKVKEHLTSCGDCGMEMRLLQALLASRPEPPLGLEDRIRARVTEEMEGARRVEASGRGAGVIPLVRRSRWAPAWALSAAAVVVLSLGIGVIWNGETVPEIGEEAIQVAVDEPLPEAWLWDDGLVAGAPVFDGLTDEQLEALIQELEG